RPREHDAVVRARRRDRDVIVQDVLGHAPGVALERVTVAPGAGLLERDDATERELARGLPVDELFVRAGIDHRSAERSRPATEQAVWRERLPVGEIRELAVVGEEAHVEAYAASARELPRPGAGPEHAQ